jgi:hypothetical protein
LVGGEGGAGSLCVWMSATVLQRESPFSGHGTDAAILAASTGNAEGWREGRDSPATAVPGEGLEPSRPLWGHLILSQARMTNFATPATSQGSVEPSGIAI